MPTIIKIFGNATAKARAKFRLGDKLERALHPVAAAMNLPCLNHDKTALRPESPCARRQAWLNGEQPAAPERTAPMEGEGA